MANQRSNKTAAQILALAPVNALDQSACVTWFAECARWSDIERYEPIKEQAWLGLTEQDRLCKRNQILMTLKAQLSAYTEITCEEEVQPDLNPSEPAITAAASTFDPTWPSEGAAATEPVLPTREGL